jgi:hypothetical protein
MKTGSSDISFNMLLPINHAFTVPLTGKRRKAFVQKVLRRFASSSCSPYCMALMRVFADKAGIFYIGVRPCKAINRDQSVRSRYPDRKNVSNSLIACNEFQVQDVRMHSTDDRHVALPSRLPTTTCVVGSPFCTDTSPVNGETQTRTLIAIFCISFFRSKQPGVMLLKARIVVK